MFRCRSRILVFQAALLGVALLTPTGIAGAGPCWSAPVDAPVSDPFRSPDCRWCPGNRGIEYATSDGDHVRAVAGGVVTFAGSVAGTGYVVIRHGDGLRATYGNVRSDHLAVDDVVVRGMTVGSTGGRLHFGIRRGSDYIDPTPLIGVWVGVVRLVPANGDPAAPAPAPRLRCPA